MFIPAPADCHAYAPVVGSEIIVKGRPYTMQVAVPGLDKWFDANIELGSASMALMGMNFVRRQHPLWAVKVERKPT